MRRGMCIAGLLAAGCNDVNNDALPTTPAPETEETAEDHAPTAAITSLSDGPYSVGAMVEFSGWVADAEDPAAELTAWWESSVDGVLPIDAVPDPQGVVSATGVLTQGAHLVTLWVEDSIGQQGSDEVMITVEEANTAPSITLSDPVGDLLVHEGELVQFTAQVGDRQDAPTDLTLSWSSDLDGEFSTQGADSSGQVQFLDGSLSSGLHLVTATVTDSGGSSATDSTSLTVNGLPTAPVVSIAPDPAVTTDELSVDIVTAAVDPEGDAITYRYAWFVDDAAAAAAPTLPAGAFVRGDAVRVEVFASDGRAEGPPGLAAAVIGNTPPAAGWVNLEPAVVYTNDVITATATGQDVDLDPVTLSHTWYVDGLPIAATGTSLDGASWFDKGHEVTVEVVPNDGIEDGLPLTSAMTVLNTPPTAPLVLIEPAQPTTADDLRCRLDVPSTDPDGDPITYVFSWDVDGAPFGAAGTTTEAGDTVFASDTADGQEWTCSAQPDDGEDPGVAGGASVRVGCHNNWSEPFPGPSLDPAWNVVFEDAYDAVYTVDGRLHIYDIHTNILNYGDPGAWARVELTRQMWAPGDFVVSARLRWDSLGLTSAMMSVGVSVMSGDTAIALGQYRDAWQNSRGRATAQAGPSNMDEGVNARPHSGTLDVQIRRAGGALEVRIDGTPVVFDTSWALADGLQLYATSFPYDENGTGTVVSTFGEVAVDFVDVVVVPGCPP